MRRKITFISFYFAPLGRADGVNRSYLARYLADLGWDINVVCAENPRGLFRNYQQDASLLEVLGPRVERHPVAYSFRGGVPELMHIAGLSADPFTHWVKEAIDRATDVAEGIVYAVVPPVSNAAVAVAVARKRGLPLVLDFRDNVSGLSRDWVMDAAAIMASTDWSRQEMLAFYGVAPATPSLTYFNGFPDVAEAAIAHAATPRSGIIYAGLMNWEQHPFVVANLIDAAQRVAPALAPQLHADFYGPSNYYTRLAWRGQIRKVATLHGYLSFSEIRQRLQSAQFGLATLAVDSKNYCIPSKVFQYIAAGLPIIASSKQGALKDLVEGSGIGLHAPPSRIHTLAPKLVELLADPAKLGAMHARVGAARNRFSLRSQAAIVSSLLERVAEPKYAIQP